MGSIISGLIGSFLGFVCCGVCNKCSAQKTGPISRIPYIFLFFIAGIFALVMSLWGENKLNLHFTSISCENCEGNGSVYRVSFCLFAFEIIHALIIGVFGLYQFHYLWFAMKFLVFCIGITLTFVLPTDEINPFMDNFSTYFSRYASAIYLLIQILILITWGYECNDFLRNKGNAIINEAEEKEEAPKCNPYFWILIIGSLLLYALSFTFLGLFFYWYANGDNCDLHKTLISLTIIFCVLNALISGLVGNGSFFVSAIVSFYGTFLLFAAFQADPDDTCNTYQKNSRSTSSLWIGWLLTFVALFYAALRADQIILLFKSSEEKEEDENNNNMEKPLIESNNDAINAEDKAIYGTDSNYNDEDIEKQNTKKDKKDKDNKKDDKNDDEENEPKLSKSQQRKSNFLFHMVMMLAACYFAMLFTNWATNQTNSIGTTGDISLWVNMGCQWIMILLFWWTIIAPYICPSRFQQPNNDE